MRPRGRAAAGVLLCLLAGCAPGGAGPSGPPGAPAGTGPLVVVSAPLSTQPWIGQNVERGARLAVEQQDQTGSGLRLRVRVRDNGGSVQEAAAIARQAVAEHAAALVTDGTGALAVADVTDQAGLPVFVVFDGGASFVDAKAHPSLFRLAPANRYLTRRLADYLAGRSPTAAVLGDTSDYGRGGADPLAANLRHDAVPVVYSALVPAGAADVSPQVLAARRAGATALLLWAGATDVAAAVRAARETGWRVPIYTGPTGEDPLVRQRMADHPDWLEGLTFVSFRITTEQGPGPFAAFRAAFERRFGIAAIGVSADGRPVVQPPDWATFSFDAVNLVAAGLTASRGRTGADLLAALEHVVTTSANGDERGFGPDDREGVSPSDMYFGRFHHLRFAPVTDDLLSTHLPPVPQ